MTCKDVQANLPAYLSAELPATERHALEQHLAACAVCKTELAAQTLLTRRLTRGLQAAVAPEGQPLLIPDLAERVRAAAAAQDAPSPAVAETAPPAPRRRWLPRLTGLVAAAALLTFSIALGWPTIARATADWPIVGPWVQKLILTHDAGLRWAYENDAVQPVKAEVVRGDVKLQILGVVADPAQTVMIWRVTGWPYQGDKQPAQHQAPDRPLRAGEDPLPPTPKDEELPPQAFITSVNDEGVASWTGSGPVWTDLGWVGTTVTRPLEPETARLQATLRIGADPLTVRFPVTREKVSRLSKVLDWPAQHELHGITARGTRVAYTPSQLWTRFEIDAPRSKIGSWNTPHEYAVYLETPEGKVYPDHSAGMGTSDHLNVEDLIFDQRKDGVALVVPAVLQDEPVHVRFDKDGIVQTVAGIPYTFKNLKQDGNRLSWRVEHPKPRSVAGLADWHAVSADGRTIPLTDLRTMESDGEGTFHTYTFAVPADFQAVAVEAHAITRWVEGPWRLPLPKP